MGAEHLTPFTKGDPRAIAAGRKGGETRRANRDARVKKAADAAKQLATFSETFERSTLGSNAANVAQYIMGRVGTGDIPVRNGDEAAALLRALVDIARLEEGQATSHTISATYGADAVARVVAIQQAARDQLATDAAGELSTAAEAVAPLGAIDATSAMVGEEVGSTAAGERAETKRSVDEREHG